MKALPPSSCWQATYAAMVGMVEIPPEKFDQMLRALPLEGDDGTMMGMALSQGEYDIMGTLHGRGFVLSPTPANAKRILEGLMQGKWPHPELVFPAVMDMPFQERIWPELLQSARHHDTPRGLTVAHIERIEALPRSKRTVEGMSEALSSLGWVTGMFEDFFPDPRCYDALARMQQLGWIDRKEALNWSKNTIANRKVATIIDRIESLAQSLDLNQATSPAQASRRAPPRI